MLKIQFLIIQNLNKVMTHYKRALLFNIQNKYIKMSYMEYYKHYEKPEG